MRLLIIGASGLVGYNLMQVASDAGHEVVGTYSQFSVAGLTHLQLGDPKLLQELLRSFKPNAVACCAAWSWVDGCEADPGRAFKENCELPAHAALAAQDVGAHFVYFSSSYIFDGEDGPYDESAVPNPLSVYGRSKLAGEEAVTQNSDGTATIIRTMGIYGPEPQQKNFIYQIRSTLSDRRRMKVPQDQLGNTTDAKNLAQAVISVCSERATGIWNVGGPDPVLPRSEFARQVAYSYDLDSSLFDFLTTNELGQKAKRPLRAGLVTRKAETGLHWKPTPWAVF